MLIALKDIRRDSKREIINYVNPFIIAIIVFRMFIILLIDSNINAVRCCNKLIKNRC